MPRYLIEVKHDEGHAACVRALDAIESYGSHFFTNADWGCKDGVHSCWVIADLENRDEAKLMIHPEFRHDARIVQLNKFTRDEIARLVAGLKK
jgi:hypothetical protein